MATYSEQELADKAMIMKRCCITEEELPYYTEHFSDPSRGDAGTWFNIIPVGRCSDGKRRSVCADYVDFLFQSPTIEEALAAANAQNRNFTVEIDFSNPQCINVFMKLRA